MQSCLMPVCACNLKSPMYHNAKLCAPSRSLFSKPTLSLTISESLLGYPRALPLSSQLPSRMHCIPLPHSANSNSPSPSPSFLPNLSNWAGWEFKALGSSFCVVLPAEQAFLLHYTTLLECPGIPGHSTPFLQNERGSKLIPTLPEVPCLPRT